MAAISAPPQITTEEQVFLIGRPPIGEYLGFVLNNTTEGKTTPVDELADQWRRANDHVKELEQSEPGWADDPDVQDLDPALHPLRDKLLAEPAVKKTYGFAPCEIGVVELDRLVVFQKHINVSYAAQLQRLLGEDPALEDVFNFCLPLDRRYDPKPRVGPVSGSPIGVNGWAFISPSTDLRVLEMQVFEPDQVSGHQWSGAPQYVVVAAIGYGVNFLSALRFGNRLVLMNGSHRAYALRAGGHTHAPMLIQTATRPEEVELLLPQIADQRELYLSAPRPPVVKDYFDERLRMLVQVPSTARQVRVQVGYDETPVPA
jgi:hypothetical protein